MGTNFYAKKIPTEREIELMNQMTRERRFEELEDYLHQLNHAYHIGKRSNGWAFAFQGKPDKKSYPCEEFEIPWDDNLDSLEKFLTQDNIEIFNEYMDKFTYSEFIDEIKDSIYVDEDHICAEEYYKQSPSSYRSSSITEKVKDGIRWCYYPFS